MGGSFPLDVPRLINGTAPSQCEGTHYQYEITRKNDGIHIGLHQKLLMAKNISGARASEILEQTRACVPMIRRVWARYDLHFDLEFSSDRSPSDRTVHGWIEVKDTDERANNYLYPAKHASYCSMILHETGHSLGLADEYEEENTCRSARAASKDELPWSIMHTSYMDIDLVDFYPRHIRAVLGQGLNVTLNLKVKEKTFRKEKTYFYFAEGRNVGYAPAQTPYCRLSFFAGLSSDGTYRIPLDTRTMFNHPFWRQEYALSTFGKWPDSTELDCRLDASLGYEEIAEILGRESFVTSIEIN